MLSLGDVGTLAGSGWLAGDVIDAYFHYLVLKLALNAPAGSPRRVTAFSYHFYNNLSEGRSVDVTFKGNRMAQFLRTNAEARSFVTPEEAFAGDIIFPVHQGGCHWLLVIFPYSPDAPHQLVYVLDPYQLQQRVTHMETVASWLRHARPADKRPIVPVYFVPDLPSQRTTDTFSCGVYICFFAYHFISSGTLPTKAVFDTNPDKGPASFRYHIAHALLLAASDATGLFQLFHAFTNPATRAPLQLPQLDQSLRATRGGRAARTVTMPRSLHVFLPTRMGFYYPFNTNQTEGQNGTVATDARPAVLNV
jgi:Ulp1 family protease